MSQTASKIFAKQCSLYWSLETQNPKQCNFQNALSKSYLESIPTLMVFRISLKPATYFVFNQK